VTDQTRAEAVGWLVSAVGRDFMIDQAKSAAKTKGGADIARQFRAWAESLTPKGEATNALRRFQIRRAADALREAAGPGVWEADEAEKWAKVVLRSAGVLR
jgi:hypothetical protein